MEYEVNKDGSIEKVVNGYQITIKTPENKINYAVGGRVFKTLRYVPLRMVNSDNDKLVIMVEIVDFNGRHIDLVTATKENDKDTDLSNIVEAACKYAEQL